MKPYRSLDGYQGGKDCAKKEFGEGKGTRGLSER